MAYCTQTDLEDALTKAKLIQLTDDEKLGAIKVARMDKAILSADTLIDSYLRGTHTVPVTGTQAALDRLRQVSVDLTRFYLWTRRRPSDIPEDLDKSYERCIAFLKDVQSGKVLLDTPTATPNTGGIFKTNKTSSDREYTAARLREF